MINNLNDPQVIRYLNSKFRRFDVINHLIEKYNLENYLEIGVFQGENIRLIKASHKDGVDPGAEGYVVPEVNYPMTSDEFFELIKDHDEIKYDIIFIDGLHHAAQVAKDLENAMKHIVDNGFIVMHDCNPVSFEAQKVPRETIAWNGDTWIAYAEFKANHPTAECCVVDTDFGVGVIRITGRELIHTNNTWTWESFNINRIKLLNLISVDEFKNTY
jgi:hypothetical protein